MDRRAVLLAKWLLAVIALAGLGYLAADHIYRRTRMDEPGEVAATVLVAWALLGVAAWHIVRVSEWAIREWIRVQWRDGTMPRRLDV